MGKDPWLWVAGGTAKWMRSSELLSFLEDAHDFGFEVEKVGAVPGTPGVEVKKGPIQVRFLGKKAFREKGK